MRCMGLLIILLAPSGCAAPPVFALREVRVVEATPQALGLDFVLELNNPNRDPLSLYEFGYSLTVEGRPIYQGRRSAEATLGAGAGRRLSLPAVIVRDRLPPETSGPRRYTLSGKLLYRGQSDLERLLFDIGLRRPKARFSERGLINLP